MESWCVAIDDGKNQRNDLDIKKQCGRNMIKSPVNQFMFCYVKIVSGKRVYTIKFDDASVSVTC